MKKNSKGFTLIELLIVIAIIAILAAIVYIALDPLTRFRDARDSRRAADMHSILNAIRIHQVDSGGQLLPTVSAMTAGSVYMVTNGNVTTGCTSGNSQCNTVVSGDANCVNLAQLVTDGYLGTVPVSPNGAGTWSNSLAGYTLQRDSNNILTLRACEAENTTEIKLVR